MVQLLDLFHVRRKRVLHTFQFQYGAIIRSLEAIRNAEQIRFNSSMVQLLVISPTALVRTTKFQFQYGAIIS